MNYQQKLQNLRNEVIAELVKITDFPEDWLPHTVYVEEEGEDNQGFGTPVYTEYKLLSYLPDGECQLLNIVTGKEEPGSLCEIEIDWLVMVLNRYGELTGKMIEAEDPKELRAFVFPIELGRDITDEELITLWSNNEGNIRSYIPSGFASLLNNEMFDELNNYVRFIDI